MSKYQFLRNKISDKLHYLDGDIFEDKSQLLLEFITDKKLTKVNANVQWGWSWDGGIDYFDWNDTVYSVYWARSCTTQEWKNIKSKMHKDFTKIKTNTSGFTIKHWHFVFNRPYGKDHKTIFDNFKKDTDCTFTIWTVYDLNNIVNWLLAKEQCVDYLVKYDILDNFEALSLKQETIEELKNNQRPKTMQATNDLFAKDSLRSKLNARVLWIKKIQSEIDIAEDFRLSYLKNYLPISLDWGIISDKLWEIEEIYRNSINQDKRKNSKYYDSLENFEMFIMENFEQNKDSYRKIDKNEYIIVPYLFDWPWAKKGCFYQQTVNWYYDFEKDIDSDSIKLNLL